MKRWVVAALVAVGMTITTVAEDAGRSPRWPVVRRQWLAEHPRCEVCSASKVEVHHLLPFHCDPKRELDPTNLITLCREDHRWVGHGGDFRRYVPITRWLAQQVQTGVMLRKEAWLLARQSRQPCPQ